MSVLRINAIACTFLTTIHPHQYTNTPYSPLPLSLAILAFYLSVYDHGLATVIKLIDGTNLIYLRVVYLVCPYREPITLPTVIKISKQT